MIKKAKTRKAVKKTTAAKPPAASVDFPHEDEIVLSADYTFRIDAPGAWSVELSVDGGEWLPCREAVGFWWFDWKTSPGAHELVVRSRKANGRPAKSSPRKFLVALI